MRTLLLTIFLLCFDFIQSEASTGDSSSINMVGTFPSIQHENWHSEVIFEKINTKISVKEMQLSFYKEVNDSADVLIFRKSCFYFDIKPGEIVKKDVLLVEEAQGDYVSSLNKNKKFNKSGVNFPGKYRMTIRLSIDDSIIEKVFYFESSSKISLNSNLGKDLNNLMQKEKKQHSALKMQNFFKSIKSDLKRIDDKYGITHKITFNKSGAKLDYYYLNAYIGSYKLELTENGNDVYKDQFDNLKNELNSNENLNLSPLLTEFKSLAAKNNDDRVLTGNINISSFASNEKDEMSGMDNNYLDIQGDLALPVFGIPVQLTGYYTTQDRGRAVKSSFINIKYDHNAAKEKAVKMLSSFKDAYGASQNQLQKYNMTYGGYISSTKVSAEQLLQTLYNQYGKEMIENFESAAKEEVMDGIRKKLSDQLDTADTAGMQRRVEDEYNKLEEQYRKYQNMQSKLDEYTSKLTQLRNNLRIDSTMVMSKINELEGYNELSNKDLLRAGSELIPEGKAKTLLGGLTNLEGGIFNKYVSRYTLAGQTIKGVNIGYDIRYAEVEATYGNTEFIDRLGNIEQYKTMSVRLNSKEYLNQKTSLGYNTITPGREIIADNEFLNYGKLIIPGFLNTVNIYALQHTGAFMANNLTVNIDAAYSDIQGQSPEVKKKNDFKNQLAVLGEIMYQIPRSDYSIITTYEKVGNDFNNNALPVSFAGIERLTTKLTGSLWQSKILFDLDYNRLMQNNLYSKGKQTRYGFSVKTNFKRMPNLFVSYKPFTTIRNPYDTFSIQQKAVIGDLLMGRINYQYKNQDNNIFRSSIIFNRSRSFIDTTDFQNTLLQGTLSWSTPLWSLFANLGSSNYQSNYLQTLNPLYNNLQFLNTQFQYKLSEKVNMSVGFDIAKTPAGISRLGFSTAVAYRFAHIPLYIRLNGRYNSFILQQYHPWNSIYGLGLDISYRLFEKLN